MLTSIKTEKLDTNMNINPNLCQKCLDDSHIYKTRPNWTLADAGVCGSCEKYQDVWDLDLVNLYRLHDLSDEYIYTHLTRLRQHVHAQPYGTLNVEQISLIVTDRIKRTIPNLQS